MAALLKTNIIALVGEEPSFGTGDPATLTAADLLPITGDSDISPNTESLERDNLNGSFLKCPNLTGAESSSGSLNVEVGIQAITGTEAGMFVGHDIIKAGLGRYVEKDATVVAGTSITEAGTGTETYDLYTLSEPTDAETSLFARMIYGTNANMLDFTGIKVESVTLDLSAGQIAKFNTSVSGVNWDAVNDAGFTVPAGACIDAEAFVVKSAVFKVDGVDIDASDVSITISNTITDTNAVTGSGSASKKTVTAKMVDVSFSLDLEGFSELEAYKNNTDGELFITLVNVAGDEINIFCPLLRRTEVSMGDNGGVLTQSIKMSAFNKNGGDALLIGTKKA